MRLDLAGKAVLVTGAASGIGLACVEAFLAEGARVGGLDRATIPVVGGYPGGGLRRGDGGQP